MDKRLIVILIIVLLLKGFAGYGRTGLSIRSAGNNLYWNNSSTWIIIRTGETGQVVPQTDDTIYVAHKILFNEDFELSDGQLIIESTGSLESGNSSLTLNNRANVVCIGNLNLLNLSLIGQCSFNLASKGKVTVNGNFQIVAESSFYIQNEGGIYGSLITKGLVQGNISELVDLEANTSKLISAPVMGAESGVFLNMYLRGYNEAASEWGEYIIPTTLPMNPMQGYEVLSLNNDTRVFTGVPSSGELKVNITAAGDGWNLIGNPYPSSLDWSLLGSGNDSGLYPPGIGTIYYKDPTSGNYAIFCPGDEAISINSGIPIIKPMQGFFIKADNSSNVSVTNDMRTHASEIESIADLPTSGMSFKVFGNGYSDEAVIRFNSDATDNFDIAFDAYKLPGNELAPGVFFPINGGTKLALNTLGDISSGLVVPLQVIIPYQGICDLHVKGASEFLYRYPIYLEDISTGLFVNLRTDSIYSFESDANVTNHSFRLHFSSPGGIDISEATDILVASGESSILIKDAKCRIGNVEVFSVDGRILYSLENTSLQTLSIPVSSGKVYITKITTDGRVETRKLFCR